MSDDPLLSILILVLLTAINAFFAASEIAVISLSEVKLRKQAEEGDRRAKKLLALMQAPDNFLSAIQIAITLAGFLNAAFAADSFADPLTQWLYEEVGFTALPVSVLSTLMVILVTIILSYFTLVLGELVPKRVAMKKTEGVARATVGVVWAVATVFRPVIWLLSKSTNGVLRLLHIDPKADEEDVSEDEIRMMVDLGEERGAIQSNEKELIDNIFEFNNTTAEDVMVHRTDMVMIWVGDTPEEILRTIRDSGISRFPVYDEFDPQEEKDIEQVDQNLWRISGSCDLEQVSEVLGMEFPEEVESDTLGGLVFAQLSAIPQDGSQVEVDTCGLHIKVLELTDRRVEWALVSKLPAPASVQDGDGQK